MNIKNRGKKCNFDVELGVDMILDYELDIQKLYNTFVLRSGDSDFTDVVKKLLSEGKNVLIFSTTKRVSKELSDSGAVIFDIQKIRDFICWNKEINISLEKTLFSSKQKGVSEETP